MKIEEYVLMNGTEQEILDLDLDSKFEEKLKKEKEFFYKVINIKDFSKIPLGVRQKVLNIGEVVDGRSTIIVPNCSFLEQLALLRREFFAQKRTIDDNFYIFGPTSKINAAQNIFEIYADKVYKVAAGAFLAFSTIVFLKNLIEYVSAHP